MHVAPRRFLLRDRTAPFHDQVDAAVGPIDTIAGYRAYVSALARFRAPIEAGLHDLAWPDLFGAWRPTLLMRALGRDLRDLGAPPPPLARPRIDADPSALLGTLYVLEGAALGSRVIAGRAATLGFDEDFGARHLAMQANPDRWRGFVAILERADGIDLERAAAAAIAAFQAASRAFAPRQHVAA